MSYKMKYHVEKSALYKKDPTKVKLVAAAGSALHKNDTKKVRLSKSQYKEDGLTDYAKEHATIKPANFWRKSEKAVISVPKKDFYSPESKLINSPTTLYGPDKKETSSWDDAVKYSGTAPSAHAQRKENLTEKLPSRENIKVAATLGGAAAIWRKMSGGKWII